MGRWQRNKGAGFERDIAQIFSDALGKEFKRKLGQARDSGNDLDVGPLVIEIKRRKTLGTVYGWLQQAIDAITGRKKRHPDERLIPVVVAREDGGVPIVILRLSDFLTLTVDELDAYLKAPQPYDDGWDDDAPTDEIVDG